MLDSNYSTEPPVASAVALAAISDKISDIRDEQKKLAEIPGMLSKMNMQLEQLTKDHQQTRQDLHETRNGFQTELDKLNKAVEVKFKTNDDEIKDLQKTKIRIEQVSEWVKYGGITVLVMIASAWVNLSKKMDDTATQTANNSQAIEVIEKTQEERRTILSDLATKLGNLQLDFYKRGISDETSR